MTDLRGYTLLLTASSALVTETCYKCGVLFAMTEDYRKNRLRKQDDFYCPNGHSQRYLGKTDAQKLAEERARHTATKDQLEAAIRDAETTRVALLRDRQRFFNGVCPCCTRTFQNVAAHMRDRHPDYDIAKIGKPRKFECGCGKKFESLIGLRTHQGHMRSEDWAQPGTSRWQSHLTVVGTA